MPIDRTKSELYARAAEELLQKTAQRLNDPVQDAAHLKQTELMVRLTEATTKLAQYYG